MAKAGKKKQPEVKPLPPAEPAHERFAKASPTGSGYDSVQLDDRNANQGTERGLQLLEHSLRSYGAGRSALADKNGRIIAGNKTIERAAELGIPLQFVETDGKTLVVVRRKDLDIDSPEGRGLAIADNRVAQLDLEWDAAQLAALQEEGVDVGAFFLPAELEVMAQQLPFGAGPDGDQVQDQLDAKKQGMRKHADGEHFTFTAVLTQAQHEQVVAAIRHLREGGITNVGEALAKLAELYMDGTT